MEVTDLWWLSLAILGVVVVVVAGLLGLVVVAARRIDRGADAIWTVGKQIAGNTVSIWMLEQTNASLARTAAAARSVERSARSIDETLKARAQERR